MSAPVPDDDPERDLVVTDPDSSDVAHISLAGDTYSMLITGDQTAGRYCLIDMHVPDGGGPPLHRHDFEEMFTILDGTVDFFFRGATTTGRRGRRSTSPPTRRTTSATTPADRCGCCACAPRPGRTSTSSGVGTRWTAGPRHRPI